MGVFWKWLTLSSPHIFAELTLQLCSMIVFLLLIASKAWEQHTQLLIPKSPGCKICFNPLASPNSNHFGRSKRLLYEMALNSVDDRRLVDDG